MDPRNITSGWRIPCENYCDQPYVVKTDDCDGAWLCIVTTGTGEEGQAGQHVIATRSSDHGRTWSAPVDIEPADGPEASYAVPLKAPGGRVYVFYNYNADNVRRVHADDPPYKGGWCPRVDSLGHFVFKYSDDHGRTWSARRYDIPQRLMDIDRRNADAGGLLYFWNVGKAFMHGGSVYVPLHKVGGFGKGFFTRSEGVLLVSDNLLSVTDPADARWETRPDGDFGLGTPPGGGPIAEEQSFVVLSDGSFYCVYRTIDGHPACAYSRDFGRTWSEPAYQAYADGRPMKHSRAANFVWRCENGKYLYWFHNHGGRFIREHANRESYAYQGRNPVWLCGGVEADSPDGKVIRWSQPEILLYDDDPAIRMSYPDLIEDDGRYFFTETQKTIARVHEVETSLIEGLWRQFDIRAVASAPAVCASGGEIANVPAIEGSFSLELWLERGLLSEGQIFLDTRTPNGVGILLGVAASLGLELRISDGASVVRHEVEPGLLTAGRHHMLLIVDVAARIVSAVVDGSLCDGGDCSEYGWSRLPAGLGGLPASEMTISPAVQRLRLYARALRTTEAIGNFRAG